VRDATQFGTVDRDVRLSDRVAAQMLETITSRDLQPGDRLPTERELSQQFAVSRTVIREAVRSLVGKGIIDARAGRGLRVTAVGPSAVWESMSLMLGQGSTPDYRDVHEVRALLEVSVAGHAATRATDAEIEELSAVVDRMRDVLPDLEEASRADLAFHRGVAAATHNRLFSVMLEAIVDPMLEIRRTTFRRPGRAQAALESHLAILAQIRARNPSGAADAMARHLDEVEHVWELMAQETG
jgi:GntR family transcriptional regulator, transcriptional repressor for pyruvate dehydrogenase complex